MDHGQREVQQVPAKGLWESALCTCTGTFRTFPESKTKWLFPVNVGVGVANGTAGAGPGRCLIMASAELHCAGAIDLA